jgi:hypothetical protein
VAQPQTCKHSHLLAHGLNLLALLLYEYASGVLVVVVVVGILAMVLPLGGLQAAVAQEQARYLLLLV